MPWPDCPLASTRSAGRCCCSGTAQAQRYAGRAARRSRRWSRRWPCFPPGQPTRVHAVVLAAAALASSLVNTELEACAEAARRAVAAARAAGARDLEAEAAITLGYATSYLGSAEAGLGPLRSGVRLALDLDIPVTALRGYIRLSDVLGCSDATREAAQAASEGLDLAVRPG